MNSFKVVIARSKAWDLVNYQQGIVRALLDKGYEVVAVATPDASVSRITALGCRYVSLQIDNTGKHPGRDLLLLWRFFFLLRSEKPDVYLGYTVKPNIYGSLAAHLAGVKVINNISGLGRVFIQKNWITKLVTGLYRLALTRSAMVLFQNEDDRKLFSDKGIVKRVKTDRIPGSGVDLQSFSYQPVLGGEKSNEIRFLYVGRIMWDKGIKELVEAAKLVRRNNPQAEFVLLGSVEQYPSAPSREQIQTWEEQGIVRYLGVAEDVRGEMCKADCILLPSYYKEGLSRTLLEAAALGRPIITTDAAGCRDAVEDGVTGYLCKPRDYQSLADACMRLMSMSVAQRRKMGKAGRAKAELEFDEQIVIDRYLTCIEHILAER